MEGELFPPLITSMTLFICDYSGLHFLVCTVKVGGLDRIVPVNYIKISDIFPTQGGRTRGD